ncbi:hypothetical protein CS8_051210 [Cupriavidus sp. 8B]
MSSRIARKPRRGLGEISFECEKWRQNQARAVLDLAGVNQHNNTECLLLRDKLGPYIGERGAEIKTVIRDDKMHYYKHQTML